MAEGGGGFAGVLLPDSWHVFVPAGTDQAPAAPVSELAAAWLQMGISLGLVLICVYVYHKYRKPYFGYWALAWVLYSLRLAAIMGFMQTEQQVWLYWHQVTTGLTALAILWAALVFSQQLTWRWAYLALAAFPVAWSYIAIYRLDNFLMAAGPAVAFLSAATLWTGIVLLRYHRRMGSQPALMMALGFILWSVHHLDYPFLRARGAWNPWGYYLDIGFELVIGAAIFLLVLDEQDRGLRVLSRLSGDLQAEGSREEVLHGLLQRLLTLPGVRGSAIYLRGGGGGGFVAGAGECEEWKGQTPSGPMARQIDDVVATGRPILQRRGDVAGPNRAAGAGTRATFSAALPVFQGGEVTGAVVVTHAARDPFAALDEDFLIALGQQIGAARAQRELVERLRLRGRELQHLTGRMIDQHETERRRLSRELHDETAQVLAAVRLQIGRALETASGTEARLMERAVEMVGTGIKGVRRVIEDLRPALLDDLGLRAALVAVTFEFERTSGLETTFRAPERLPALPGPGDLAVFRALQEGLANVARHAGASEVEVEVGERGEKLFLTVSDDGVGPGPEAMSTGGQGLTGMRERMEALGGSVELRARSGGGARLEVRVPLGAEEVT